MRYACLLLLFLVTNTFAEVDPALMARMKSCDPRISLAAVKEVIEDPTTLQEPPRLFNVAYYMYGHGKKDEAVFWFYAAQLRFRFVAAIEKGDYEQVLSIFISVTGHAINNYAFQDVAKLERIVNDVLKWDKATPNAAKALVTSPEKQAAVRKVYAGLDEFKAKLRKDKLELEKAAKLAAQDIQMRDEQSRAMDCPPNDAGESFDGAWGVEMCNPKLKKEACGGFYVYLVQKGRRICGDHYMATPGLGRLNEGGPRSVVGFNVRALGYLQVTSGRDGTKVRAMAKRVNDTIDWKIREVMKKGVGGDSPLIGDNLVLTRQNNDEALKRVTEQCEEYFESVAK